ncbi:DUF2807 domain-containing protein [Aureitalea sp. L0-47]|uniref:DUF2807 domain-containing protein n=1 Tax=Aureitalea sp. L0-47 TaxID=2816962 RepID=UPI0022381012|nr:DUF2807 domain-containing protein [Aureitalea sp. L0-47]MCW5518468.1 DUF2807 domain-containing protein [Aureitalea sp. L0-47]
MKRITLLLLLVGITSMAQIKGNKNIISKNVNASNIKSVELQLYADVIVDQSLEEGITITGDENLISLINTEVVSGQLVLDQKEWIQASQNIQILIGAPTIEKVTVDVHKTLLMRNIIASKLTLDASIGKIVASGNAEEVFLSLKNGQIDASKLKTQDANLKISGSGKAILNVFNTLNTDLSEDSRLVLIQTPKIVNRNAGIALKKGPPEIDSNLKHVKFRIKNNSWNRTNFLVIGPNKDGSTFSYGFPLMPGATRDENWTVGTKVFKTNTIGKRTLLITVKEEDQGKTVKLFK